MKYCTFVFKLINIIVLFECTVDSDSQSVHYICVLEFLPYRRMDWSARRDEKGHSYFCSHGYVCVRVDMRGSGDSEGFIYDECERQEHEDCCDVINWISQQDWCTGDVGKLNFRIEAWL